MSELVALAVSFGLMGGVASICFFELGLVGWAGFIAWGCYYHSGGNAEALKKTIAGNTFGSICAWVVVMVYFAFPILVSFGLVSRFLVIGLALAVLVIASRIKLLSDIPASVYGTATTFAYVFQTPNAMNPEMLLHFGRANGLIRVVASMVLGALFGVASQKLAAMMKRS